MKTIRRNSKELQTILANDSVQVKVYSLDNNFIGQHRTVEEFRNWVRIFGFGKTGIKVQKTDSGLYHFTLHSNCWMQVAV